MSMGTINLKVPDDLRDRYKARCALEHTTMQKELVKYIERQVKTEAKK